MVLSACSTRKPLMVSRTSLAFCGLVRWNLASARNSRIFSAVLAMIASSYKNKTRSLAELLLFWLRRSFSSARGVALEGAGGGELAKLVADHVLRDVHRDKLAAV